MERPSEMVPLEDLLVLDETQPKIPSVLQTHGSSIWKLSWDHRISVHRQNKSPDMKYQRASHRGFGCQESMPLGGFSLLLESCSFRNNDQTLAKHCPLGPAIPATR